VSACGAATEIPGIGLYQPRSAFCLKCSTRKLNFNSFDPVQSDGDEAAEQEHAVACAGRVTISAQ
jgi:hypothetical protein